MLHAQLHQSLLDFRRRGFTPVEWFARYRGGAMETAARAAVHAFAERRKRPMFVAQARCDARPPRDWFDGGGPDDRFTPGALATLDAEHRDAVKAVSVAVIRRVAAPWDRGFSSVVLEAEEAASLPLILAQAADVGFQMMVVVTSTESSRREAMEACEAGFMGPNEGTVSWLTSATYPAPVALAEGGTVQLCTTPGLPMLAVTRQRAGEAWRPWITELTPQQWFVAPTLLIGWGVDAEALAQFDEAAGISFGWSRRKAPDPTAVSDEDQAPAEA
jgi:hypothetical protein